MMTDERLAQLERDQNGANLLECFAEIRRLRAALLLIAEVIPEYDSEAWMVQTAKDALDGVKNADR